MLRLILYSRPACHLCEEMQAELHQALAGRPFELKVEDVDKNDDLRQRYGLRIPVLAIKDGDEICHHKLNHDALMRSLSPE
jgi:hypothetical protein